MPGDLSTVELFCEPSPEARRLQRWLGPLTSPGPGEDRPSWRCVRHFMVAPFTQLTLLSFDLQMFLFDVFHTTRTARAGHGFGMGGVNLFLLALAWTASPAAATGLAAALLAWYGALAARTRLPLWWAVMGIVMAALVGAASVLASILSPATLLGGLLGSGAVIAISHAVEPTFPPRAGDPMRWTPMREYIVGPAGCARPPALVARRLGRVVAYAFIGWAGELWASPRLLPYNVLRLMLAAGYAPELAAVLDDRAHRAWASGNPALDFVGIGGGSFLPPQA